MFTLVIISEYLHCTNNDTSHKLEDCVSLKTKQKCINYIYKFLKENTNYDSEEEDESEEEEVTEEVKEEEEEDDSEEEEDSKQEEKNTKYYYETDDNNFYFIINKPNMFQSCSLCSFNGFIKIQNF
jgi:hypothetical protein